MKIALITDAQLGLATAHLVQQAFKQAVAEQSTYSLASQQEADILLLVGGVTGQQLAGRTVARTTPQALLDNGSQALVQALDQTETLTAESIAPQLATKAESKTLVAVTACPTGVAHTFMAAEAIEAEAKKRGWSVRVETRGSVGAGHPLTAEEVAAADLVFIATDIEVDLAQFAGKPMYRTTTGLALKKTGQEFDKALLEAKPYQATGSLPTKADEKQQKLGAYRHLLTGVSFMLPMVVAGGLCIALSFAFGIRAFEQPGTLAAALMQIGGGSAFALMVPVLTGYIAFSIADRPGLAPGLIGGMLATSLNAGFLGGIIAGFIAGYTAKFISQKVRLPSSMAALKPILLIPLLASLVTGLVMIYLLGKPISLAMEGLTHWLGNMGTANALLLGAVLGAMQCCDMGGPINKVAYAFGVGLLSTKTYAPMAAIMAAGMVPPLAMAVATFIARPKFAKAEQESGKAALVLGLCYITEGVIPFAARDPLRVLPCCIIGGALTGALSMLFGAKLMAPHGGLFVLLIPGAITPIIQYLCAIAAGTLLAGISYAVLKRPDSSHEVVE